MTRHFRECNFCANNTNNKPDVVIFGASEQITRALSIQPGIEIFICEQHFDTSDIKTNGTSKRLVSGALPINFPRKESVFMDHSYVQVQSAALDLVGTKICSLLSIIVAIFCSACNKPKGSSQILLGLNKITNLSYLAYIQW